MPHIISQDVKYTVIKQVLRSHHQLNNTFNAEKLYHTNTLLPEELYLIDGPLYNYLERTFAQESTIYTTSVQQRNWYLKAFKQLKLKVTTTSHKDYWGIHVKELDPNYLPILRELYKARKGSKEINLTLLEDEYQKRFRAKLKGLSR